MYINNCIHYDNFLIENYVRIVYQSHKMRYTKLKIQNSFTEESIVTETNETSDEDEKEIQNEQTNDSEVEGNAKEEAVIAPAVETSSEPARGLGLY